MGNAIAYGTHRGPGDPNIISFRKDDMPGIRLRQTDQFFQNVHLSDDGLMNLGSEGRGRLSDPIR